MNTSTELVKGITIQSYLYCVEGKDKIAKIIHQKFREGSILSYFYPLQGYKKDHKYAFDLMSENSNFITNFL
jgi:hypothetical protein